MSASQSDPFRRPGEGGPRPASAPKRSAFFILGLLLAAIIASATLVTVIILNRTNHNCAGFVVAAERYAAFAERLRPPINSSIDVKAAERDRVMQQIWYPVMVEEILTFIQMVGPSNVETTALALRDSSLAAADGDATKLSDWRNAYRDFVGAVRDANQCH